jgi:hypothetical protein
MTEQRDPETIARELVPREICWSECKSNDGPGSARVLREGHGCNCGAQNTYDEAVIEVAAALRTEREAREHWEVTAGHEWARAEKAERRAEVLEKATTELVQASERILNAWREFPSSDFDLVMQELHGLEVRTLAARRALAPQDDETGTR